MKSFKSILCASLLTLAISSAALAGDITGKPTSINRAGDITGKPIKGDITGGALEIILSLLGTLP